MPSTVEIEKLEQTIDFLMESLEDTRYALLRRREQQALQIINDTLREVRNAEYR